ncbi:hypothetical protein LB504_011786 [Fusarium proliferatum]|nr:hypothetical protein LB504_011786 [Fusarium proliferatum]
MYPSKHLPFELVEFLQLFDKEGLLDRRILPVEGSYKQEDFATEGRQPDATGIIRILPGNRDFHRFITQLAVAISIDSLFDLIRHIVAFCLIRLAALGWLCDAVSGFDMKKSKRVGRLKRAFEVGLQEEDFGQLKSNFATWEARNV